MAKFLKYLLYLVHLTLSSGWVRYNIEKKEYKKAKTRQQQNKTPLLTKAVLHSLQKIKQPFNVPIHTKEKYELLTEFGEY